MALPWLIIRHGGLVTGQPLSGYRSMLAFWLGGASEGVEAAVPVEPTPEVGGVGGLAKGGRRKPVGPYAPAFPRRGTVRNIYLPDDEAPELEQAEARPTEARPQTAKPTLAPIEQTVLPVVMNLAGGQVMMGLVDTIAAQAAFDFHAAQEADDEAALIAILAAIS